MSRIKLAFLFFLFGFTCFTSAKGNKTANSPDSLVEWVSEALESSISDSALVYRNALLSIAQAQDKKDAETLALAFRNLAVWHRGSPSIDSSLHYTDRAINIYTRLRKNMELAETYLEKECTYKQRTLYSDALEQDFKALSIYEELNDQEGIAKCYTLLCDLMYYRENYREGADYCQKAIEIQYRLKLYEDLARSYRYKADNLLMLSEYEAALVNINEAIVALKKAGKPDYDLMPAYNTRGNIYKYLERYDDALNEYKTNLELAAQNNKESFVYPTLGNIGHIYKLQEKYNEAIPFFKQAIVLMKKYGDIQNLRENYMHVSDSYYALGEYKEAADYQKLYFEASLEAKDIIISQLESELVIKYETAKKDKTIVEQGQTISEQKRTQILYVSIAGLLGIILLGMYFALRNIGKKRKELKHLNVALERRRQDAQRSNEALSKSMEELKTTQSQLIHSEKMASLGELTAGIAHEIQNPLNFVNNFSELSNELIDEMNHEIEEGHLEEAKEIANDVKQNLEKINHHGKRADAIVKGMLQHSRTSVDVKEPTDINALCDEYLRLAYHGLRAKKKSFNARLETQFDESIDQVKVIPQDIGRVILNIITNAFYAVEERKKNAPPGYEPTIKITTRKLTGKIEIAVEDNGNGIPEEVVHKVFQPFFTTKPTGQGTGLGLSMSYDIITKTHGGELKVESTVGEGTRFILLLPDGV